MTAAEARQAFQDLLQSQTGMSIEELLQVLKGMKAWTGLAQIAMKEAIPQQADQFASTCKVYEAAVDCFEYIVTAEGPATPHGVISG